MNPFSVSHCFLKYLGRGDIVSSFIAYFEHLQAPHTELETSSVVSLTVLTVIIS